MHRETRCKDHDFNFATQVHATLCNHYPLVRYRKLSAIVFQPFVQRFVIAFGDGFFSGHNYWIETLNGWLIYTGVIQNVASA
jgi:hypothetical protein